MGWDVGIGPTYQGRLEAAKGDGVRISIRFITQPRLWRFLLAVCALQALAGSAAHAQNLDQGKSATRLFSDSCATCHRSAAALAKGRSRTVLFQFLQQHYATSSNTAAELASYLAAVDTRHGRPPRPAASRSANRPPRPAPSAPRN
jgi:mono/diheme cytochrome c family protein